VYWYYSTVLLCSYHVTALYCAWCEMPRGVFLSQCQAKILLVFWLAIYSVIPNILLDINDGPAALYHRSLCVFPCFAVPRSIIRYRRAKCSSTIPSRARATCTAHTYPLNIKRGTGTYYTVQQTAVAAVPCRCMYSSLLTVKCCNAV
jgi:hypothetical protein